MKDTWLSTIKKGIKSNLKNVGKGWFNLGERRREVYDISKLKKFMDMVRLMMEDSLRQLMEDSLEAFAHFLEIAAASKVVVSSTALVSVTKTWVC